MAALLVTIEAEAVVDSEEAIACFCFCSCLA
jgi:hypothetical protein